MVVYNALMKLIKSWRVMLKFLRYKVTLLSLKDQEFQVLLNKTFKFSSVKRFKGCLVPTRIRKKSVIEGKYVIEAEKKVEGSRQTKLSKNLNFHLKT